MSGIHQKILTEKQTELLPFLKSVSNEFGLVGGTAVALQLGHRESIDFDLFKKGNFDALKLKRIINKFFPIEFVRVDNPDEYTLRVNEVQITFFNYPFDISYDVKFDNIISIPNLVTLAAMKAYALGKRAKWKDYVDIYFILKQYAFSEIIKQANTIFGGEFNEKLFREQLSYYADVNYGEEVIYKNGYFVSDTDIKKYLTKASLQ